MVLELMSCRFACNSQAKSCQGIVNGLKCSESCNLQTCLNVKSEEVDTESHDDDDDDDDMSTYINIDI